MVLLKNETQTEWVLVIDWLSCFKTRLRLKCACDTGKISEGRE